MCLQLGFVELVGDFLRIGKPCNSSPSNHSLREYFLDHFSIRIEESPSPRISNKKSHQPSHPSSQEAYNQNRTEESKHRDSFATKKTRCCCGGKVGQTDNPPPQKKRWGELFVDFREGNLMMILCVGWDFCEWFGVKKSIWDLGLVI